MLICQEIQDKKFWDSFVTSQTNHTFLHSWAWGKFNAAMAPRQARDKGKVVWRLGVYTNPNYSNDRENSWDLVAVALVVKVHAKRGNFLLVPHGPIGDKRVLRPPGGGGGLLAVLKNLAEQENVSFIRISPLFEDIAENRMLFEDLGFRPAPIHMHAETTWSLDLRPSEDELLMGMRKTTRNLIRRAIREGVTIQMGNSGQDVELFYRLYHETVKKHNFTPFSLIYIKNQVRIIPDIKIFTAYHQNQLLASAVIVFYGNSAFYHHGASIPSKIPAAYLLQWEAIREAKRRGHTYYNFWGIVKGDAPVNHPWQGITLFKKGFGGFQTDYMRAHDLPLSWRYWVNWAIETMRRRKRNL